MTAFDGGDVAEGRGLIRSTGKRMSDPDLLVSGAVPVLVTVMYTLVVGVRDLGLLLGLLAVTVALLGLSWWQIRRRLAGSSRADLVLEVLAASLGAPVIGVFAGWVVAGPAAPFGLIVALQLVTLSYVLSGPVRLSVQGWAAVMWPALLWGSGGGADVAAGHLLGAAAVVLLANRAADAQTEQRQQERDNRTRAEALARMLTGVLQVNSLEPQAVLQAVVSGLRDLGLGVVEIRRIDEVDRVARLEAGETALDVQVDPAVPFDTPLLAELLDGWQPVTVEDARTDPRVTQPHLGYHASMFLPLSLGGGGRGLLSVATLEGPLTDLQVQAIHLLADHAARALERASIFEVDARIVDDLRHLDARTQDFISTASHELRTPLTVISGLGQTLRHRWDDLGAERRADLLQRIDANAERLSTIVRTLLDTSAFERGELRPTLRRINLAQTVRRLVDRLATVTAAYPVEVEVDRDLEVEVDPALFDHVVENLLANVAKHTPQGTRVVVAGELSGDRVRVAVTDHGPGIAQDDLPHVLDRFYRGGDPDRRPSGGLGLGLALSQQIVQAHGGALDVASEPGVGTTFAFTVPSASTAR